MFSPIWYLEARQIGEASSTDIGDDRQAFGAAMWLKNKGIKMSIKRKVW